MQPPPDGVVHAVHDFIRDERQRSFSFLGRHSHLYMRQQDLLAISPADRDDIETARTIHKKDVLASFTDEQFFVFDEPMGSMSRLVVIIVHPGDEMTIERMVIAQVMSSCSKTGGVVRCDDTSGSLAINWLQKTYTFLDDARMKDSEAQYEEQRLWWDGISKIFPLMELPLELREAIYLQTLGGPIIVPDYHKGRVIFGRGVAYQRKRIGKNRDPDIEPPNMTLMRANKQVQREAIAVANKLTFKRLRLVGAQGLSTAMRQPESSLSRLSSAMINLSLYDAFLRNVQLEMSATRYFALIGIDPVARAPLSKSATNSFRFDSLRRFRGLQNLDFRFISPKHLDAACPWAQFSQKHEFGEHSCQKTWIDWWFTLAWERLHALKELRGVRYTLSGCVKESSKQYWETALADKTDSYSNAIAAKALQIKQGKTDNLPLPCRCSYPCSKAGSRQTHAYEDHEHRQISGLQEHVDKAYWDFRD